MRVDDLDCGRQLVGIDQRANPPGTWTESGQTPILQEASSSQNGPPAERAHDRITHAMWVRFVSLPRARATGLFAVSARDPDELERPVADIEPAAIQASCENRRLWGQHAQAFSAAALPLCRPD